MGHVQSVPPVALVSAGCSADRFVGAVVGSALGDALGAVVEGWPAVAVSTFCNKVAQSGSRPHAVLYALKTGAHAACQYTDDTQLARELLLSAVATSEEHGEPKLEQLDFAVRASGLYAAHKMVGCGMGTAKALGKLAAGVPISDAAALGDAGNGAAVRAWVIALVFAHDEELAVENAVQQARVTHRDRRAAATSAAVTSAAFWATRFAAPLDESAACALISAAASAARPIHEGVSIAISSLITRRKLTPQEMAALLQREHPARGNERSAGVSGYCIPTVVWAFYCFLRHPGDFLAALTCCLRMGGDTDSTCALVGALSGGHLGSASLPSTLTAKLHDQGEWGHGALVELALRAWRVHETSLETPPPTV